MLSATASVVRAEWNVYASVIGLFRSTCHAVPTDQRFIYRHRVRREYSPADWRGHLSGRWQRGFPPGHVTRAANRQWFYQQALLLHELRLLTLGPGCLDSNWYLGLPN